jgi:hypothetical protein
LSDIKLNSFQKVPALAMQYSGIIDIKAFEVSDAFSEKVEQLKKCNDVNIR